MKKEEKSSTIVVRIPKSLEQKLRRNADATGKTLSEIIRLSLKDEKIILKQKPPAINEYTSRQLLYYFSKISNNMNQIAKKLNILAKMEELTVDEAEYYLDMMEAMYLELRNARERIKC